MSVKLKELRQKASDQSEGSSSNEIIQSIVSEVKELSLPSNCNVFDIGCGKGALISSIQEELTTPTLKGCDYTDFSKNVAFDFFQHDCNHPIPLESEQFDLVLSSEVIEHLENPRLFLREISRLLKPGGYAILSTPNIENLASLISFILRGYHSAFGGKAYPAHITPVGEYDMKNIVTETGELKIQKTKFIPNGRIPGTSILWKTLFPFVRGKRFSDNYYTVIKKHG